MKILLALVAALSVVACAPKAYETTTEYTLPKGLQDCSIYRLHSPTAQNVVVVRCPQSSTSVDHNEGKLKVTTSVQEL